MRRLLLGVCLLLLAGCGGASPSATSTGSPATSAPTSAPSPTPAVSPTPSCPDAVMHHQLGELVTVPNWQITLTSVSRTGGGQLGIVFTFKNTTSNEVSVVTGSTTGDPYIFSFIMFDSATQSIPQPEVSSNANPTSVPSLGISTFTLVFQVNDIIQGYELGVGNPVGCFYGGWDINAS